MDLFLKDIRVLVAASSSGLGAATARVFSQEGAVVTLNGRNAASLDEAATSLRSETHNQVHTVPADVSKPQQAAELVERAARAMGGLDILVTNAGGPPSGTFDAFDLDDWKQAIDLTLLSHVQLIRTALPYLRQSQHPAILTITSLTAREPLDNLTLSNGIRPAVVGLTNSLSKELASHNIRVNSILPGTVHTGRIDSLIQSRSQASRMTEDEVLQQMQDAVPLKRIGQPDEFARVAVFLCSPAASYVSGVALVVDGGRSESI